MRFIFETWLQKISEEQGKEEEKFIQNLGVSYEICNFYTFKFLVKGDRRRGRKEMTKKKKN